jgi:hypothetical protein
MTDRLEAFAVRPYEKNGETKTAFTRIGIAWPNRNGGYRLSLDALPVASLNDGKLETTILLLPPKDKGDSEPF